MALLMRAALVEYSGAFLGPIPIGNTPALF